jgi:hypothetical protein
VSSPNSAGLGFEPRTTAVIRVIENQITTLRPYNARYTGDNRSIFRKRYMEIITLVSLVLLGFAGLVANQ